MPVSFREPTRTDFERARQVVREHARHTPLLPSPQLSELTGYDVWLKAEMFQHVGSYKLRGPLYKFSLLSEEEKRRGVICSSAGNHAQGVALAARIHGIRAVVVMAENATPSKVAATRGYGAEVVLHGTIWDEADQHARQLVEEQGLTYIHPFDDIDLITGQGTLGMEVLEDLPDVDAIVVPIGGGGLISGVTLATRVFRPATRIFGLESSGAPGMLRSVEAGHVVTLDTIDCVIDGLRVKTVGTLTREIVGRYVERIITLSDAEIFDALLWTLSQAKLVVEGAAAAPIGALLQRRIELPPDSRVVCVLSGGNVNLERLRGLSWN